MGRQARLRWLLGAPIVLLVSALLWRQLQSLSFAQLREAWIGTPVWAIAGALLGTALSFACLAGYEQLATRRVAPGRVPSELALGVGAVSHAISNTLGFHLLTGGALRYRAYCGLGLELAQVARIVAVVATCVGTGVVVVAAMAFVSMQFAGGGRVLGALAVAFVALSGLLGWARARRGAGLLALPPREIGFVCLLGAIEMAAAIGALYVLLPTGAVPSLAPFILLFVSAMLLGIVSHAPGGIGVFEATILAAVPDGRQADVLVGLLLYRVIYNLLPFVLAIAALSLAALHSRWRRQSVRGRV